jgi:hypothetical protein
MRVYIRIATLGYLVACAHGGAGNSERSRGPSPAPSIAVADTNQLYVADNVQSLWVFEVWPATPQADREVGHFGRQEFISLFDDMHRQACGRGVLLVVVGADTDHLTYKGRLRLVGFFPGRGGRGLEGLEIPC